MRLRAAGAVLALVLWAAPAFAQGCAMCGATAARSPQQGQNALRRAIVVMLLPSITVMAGFAGLAYRKRHGG